MSQSFQRVGGAVFPSLPGFPHTPPKIYCGVTSRVRRGVLRTRGGFVSSFPQPQKARESDERFPKNKIQNGLTLIVPLIPLRFCPLELFSKRPRIGELCVLAHCPLATRYAPKVFFLSCLNIRVLSDLNCAPPPIAGISI